MMSTSISVKAPLSWVKNAKRFARKVVNALGWKAVFRSFTITQFVSAKNAIGTDVENYRVLFPSERIEFTEEIDKAFLNICDESVDFKNGVFERSEIFVCDVVPAYINIGGGIVCTRDFKFLVEPGLEYRLDAYSRIGWSKPFLPNRIQRIPNLCSSLLTIGWSKNYWHWLYEDLPKIYSLVLAVPSEKLTLLMPDDLSTFQKEFLKYLLPAHFEVRYIPHGTWLKADRFVMPSFISRRRNGLLPFPYYEYIRNTIFQKLDLPLKTDPSERIYISRAKANHRRVLNEEELTECLAKHGFKTVFLEAIPFKEQIDLFRKAEVVIGAHGAGLATTLFSGKIKVFALYPNREPLTFFFTQCKGLEQDHYFLTHDMPGLDDDFEVDISKLETLLLKQLN
jgi:Glycosyltransferase 61